MNCKFLKHIFLLSIALLCCNYIFPTIPMGSWKTHFSYYDSKKCVEAFGSIYVLSSGSIFSYTPNDKSLYIYDKIGGLNDSQILDIAFCESENALLLLYSNGNIDLLYSNGTIYNFTDLKNYNINNKTIYNISVIERYGYISTNFGIVLFDIKKREIKNTYNFGESIICSTLHNNFIYCATNNGVYKGCIEDNLLNKNNWKRVSNHQFYNIFSLDNIVVGYGSNKSLYSIDDKDNIKRVRDSVDKIYHSNNRLLLCYNDTLYIYDSLSNFSTYSFDYSNTNYIYIDKSGKNICNLTTLNGLSHLSITDNRLSYLNHNIFPAGPRRNYAHNCKIIGDKLVVVAGSHNYSNLTYPGAIMIYDNYRWSQFEDNLDSITGVPFINLTSIVQNPTAHNNYFVGSGRQGLYEFRDGKFYKLHTYNNSALKNILPSDPKNYVSVDGLCYDKFSNLWMVNNEVDTVIRVLTENGEWFSIYNSKIANLPTLKDLKFDRFNRVWINSSRYKPGLFCLDYNNTITNNRDDKSLFIGPTFVNQDGVKESINYIYFFEFDYNDVLWIGTDRGVFLLKDHSNILSSLSNVVLERVKISRNDGTNFADYLLSEVRTTSIAIDAANRKWIGTYENGVFLVSDNGEEIIYHFTTDNSPLPSNYIHSIAINSSNGSIFFGTDLGIVEYAGNATMSNTNFKESSIFIYPNPANCNTDDYITINGLENSSEVLILSSSGTLIHKAHSNGGTFVWNMRSREGEYISTGVYTAIIKRANGKTESTSFTIIR